MDEIRNGSQNIKSFHYLKNTKNLLSPIDYEDNRRFLISKSKTISYTKISDLFFLQKILNKGNT